MKTASKIIMFLGTILFTLGACCFCGEVNNGEAKIITPIWIPIVMLIVAMVMFAIAVMLNPDEVKQVIDDEPEEYLTIIDCDDEEIKIVKPMTDFSHTYLKHWLQERTIKMTKFHYIATVTAQRNGVCNFPCLLPNFSTTKKGDEIIMIHPITKIECKAKLISEPCLVDDETMTMIESLTSQSINEMYKLTSVIRYDKVIWEDEGDENE